MIDVKTLAYAQDLCTRGKVEAAWEIAKRALAEDPHSVLALSVSAQVHEKIGNIGLAYHLLRRITELEPRESASWTNFGRVAEDMWRTTEAERAYNKGLEVCTRDSSKASLLGNMAALMIDNGRFREGEKWARRALAVDDKSRGALTNLGFCQLANHEWAEGWANYRHTIGSDWRPRKQYKDEPDWDGSPDKSVVFYGDQGLGDEICFVSMLNDAKAICRKVVLDCDARLANLFARSFPGVKVYGTRWAKQSDGVRWDKADWDIDASLPMGQVGEYVRTTPESFPADTYLVPDADRVFMWRSLFAAKRKQVIGIAWSGGIPKTGKMFRTLKLDQLRPLFAAIDAHWVSLQYTPSTKEIEEFRLFNSEIDLKEYPHATLTRDYDDTAALVAACDLVISVPTAVVHLAGALGTPCIAMKSPKPCWKFHKGLAWHPKVQMIENSGDWDRTIETTIGAACEALGIVPKAAEEQGLAQVFHIKGNGAAAHA